MHASAEHLQMQLRYGQLRRLPTKAKASQAYTGSNQAHCTARQSAGLGNGQAHQAASTQRGPQSTLSISFEPCVPYRVLVCSCLRNRSEKNRLVQTYELRSALSIIRRGSLSASRICNEIQFWRSLRSSNTRNRLEGAVSGRTG